MNHDHQDKPSFFAVIKGDINQLKVPTKIVTSLGEELWKNESIILIGSSGEKWQVSILKKENDMYLQNIGWENFMKENSIMNEEFLFFTYDGEKRFKVGIFSRNGIERPSIKKAEAPTVVKRKRGRPSMKREEKVAAEAPVEGKRKRGRPRKNPAAEPKTVCANKEKEKEKEKATATLVAKKENEKEKEAPETIVARRKNLAAKRVCVKNEKEKAVETMEDKKNKGRPRKSVTPSPPVVIIID